MIYSHITIREAVAEKLRGSGETVAAMLVDQLAQEEINRRAGLITRGLARLEKAEKEARKIRPDQKSLNVDGTVASETFSAARFDEMKKAKDGIERLTMAINRALNDLDFSRLSELDQAAKDG